MYISLSFSWCECQVGCSSISFFWQNSAMVRYGHIC